MFRDRAGISLRPAPLALTALVLLTVPDASRAESTNGQDVYAKAHCAICHGGLGYGGAGPRLRGDMLLSADTYVVGQILLGRGIMPSFADKLSDGEIAAVATYVRTSWGNDFGAVTAARVAEIRKSLSNQAEGDAPQERSAP